MSTSTITQLPIALSLNGSEYIEIAVPQLAPIGGFASYRTTISGIKSGTVGQGVANGGTGQSTLTLYSLLVGNGISPITQIAVPASGTLLQGNAAANPSWTATPTLGVAGTTAGTLAFAGLTSGTTTIVPNATASGTVTLPAATDTLVGKATIDTLTNKTFDTAGTGNVLKINGTAVSAVTGTGSVVLATSPTLVTPTLGVALATSVNGNTFTTGTYTLTGVAGKTLTFNNSLTLAGTDATTMTFPGSSDTVVTLGATQTLTAKTVTGLLYTAGSTSVAPATYASGTNLTSAVAGAIEFDGVQHYRTIDTSSGRGAVPVEQYVHLTAAGSTISTIANYFGSTSNISLVASAYYLIEIECFFLNTTSGTVTWTLTNSAAPTSQNIDYLQSPLTGIVAPGSAAATMLAGQIYNDTTAALAWTTGTLTTAVNHYAKIKVWLQNGTGTSLKVQATKNVGGTITPGINSYWRCRRVSPSNIGTLSA